jgi:hypothetical protein
MSDDSECWRNPLLDMVPFAIRDAAAQAESLRLSPFEVDLSLDPQGRYIGLRMLGEVVYDEMDATEAGLTERILHWAKTNPRKRGG